MIALALVCTGLLCGELPESESRAAGLRGLLYDDGRWVTPDEVLGRDRQDARLRPCSPSTRHAGRSARDGRGPAEPSRDGATGRGSRPRRSPTSPRSRGWSPTTPRPADDWAIGGFGAVDDQRRDRRRVVRGRGPVPGRSRVGAEDRDLATMAERTRAPDQAIRGLTRSATPGRSRHSVDRSATAVWEQTWAIRVLGQIDSPRSIQILAELSVFGDDQTVRAGGPPPARPPRPPDLRRAAHQLAPRPGPLRGRPPGRGRGTSGRGRVPSSSDPTRRPPGSERRGRLHGRTGRSANPDGPSRAMGDRRATIPGRSTAPTSPSS